MGLPGKPLTWSPRGASDTLDSSTSFAGAMGSLQNLIPDPTTRDLWQARPAALELSALGGNPFSSGFSSGFGVGGTFSAFFISCLRVIGTRAYGMVRTTNFPGHDEPFIFDIPTRTFISITGMSAANTPVSPAIAGAWSPPSMALIGAKIIVAHPGFTGAAGAYFGVLDISNAAAPTWTATNTSTTALAAPPTWVVNFNGRCFYLVNPPGAQPAAYMSDSLNPTVITNANQILTFGDNVSLTCAAGLPLANQLGGVLQSLMIFKGVTNIYQVTGDYALMNLAINTLNVATGTFAPNTLVPTSKGLAFVAPDGVRLIDFSATVNDPIGNSGDGITLPFIYSVVPSRMAAAYNSGVYRVQVQNGAAPGSPSQQWWFDFTRGVWCGPHTQPASLLAPSSNTFIVSMQGDNSALYQSDPVQGATSTYVELDAQLKYNYATPMLPDTDQMAEVAMVEATLAMALVAGNPVQISAQDQNGVVFDTVTLTPAGSPTLWGAFQWGNALWQGTQNALYPRRLDWHYPIVFQRMGLSAVGNCAQGFKIGRLHMRYQVLGYLLQPTG